MHLLVIAFVHARFGTPAVVFHLAEKPSVIADHPRATGFVMIELNETAVPEFFFPVRDVFGQNMRVNVNGEELAHDAKMRNKWKVRQILLFLNAPLLLGFGIAFFILICQFTFFCIGIFGVIGTEIVPVIGIN